jgi:hypothetical protein
VKLTFLPRTALGWTAFVAWVVYGFIGWTAASVMQDAVPAISTRGQIYIAATWPLHLKASPVEAPVPQWAFSFPSPTNSGGERE